MAPVFIANWLYGVLTMTAQGNVFENTFSLRNGSGGPVDGSDLNALAQNWWTANGTAIRAAASVNLTYQSVRIRDMSSSAGEEGEFVIPSGTTGTIGEDTVPYNATSVLSWRSSHVGRSGRGRWYFCGIPENQVSGNIVSAGYQVLLAAVAAAITGYSGTVAVPVDSVVASKTDGVLYTIVGTIIDLFVDSQRRRLQGRGI